MTAWLLAAGGAAVALLFAFLKGRKSANNANRAREADAYEKHLQEIADAASARNAVGPGACQTTSTGGTKAVCSIFPTITYSSSDTPETVIQIRRHNAGHESYCQ